MNRFGKTCTPWRPLAVLALVLPWLPGCLPAGLTRSARTLEPGEHEVGAALSWSRWQHGAVDWFDGTVVPGHRDASTFQIANPVPEASYRHGWREGLDTGVRIGFGSGFGELDVRWRAWRSAGLAVALNPAFGMVLIEAWKGSRLTLPVLVTWAPARAWAVTLALRGVRQTVEAAALDPFVKGAAQPAQRWSRGESGWSAGGGLGVEYRTDDWFVMPTVDVATGAGAIGALGRTSPYELLQVTATLSGGITFGKELARFRKAAEELERRQGQ
ncbi:MAG: hypothetical protein EXR79_10325 [Myxococcales bacterium]|nr:hypothetical protein [Myxococcales bacterium]